VVLLALNFLEMVAKVVEPLEKELETQTSL
jgi:hypothetical protein